MAQDDEWPCQSALSSCPLGRTRNSTSQARDRLTDRDRQHGPRHHRTRQTDYKRADGDSHHTIHRLSSRLEACPRPPVNFAKRSPMRDVMYIVNPWAVQANFRALASQGEGSGVLSTKTPDGRIGLRGSLSKAPIVPRIFRVCENICESAPLWSGGCAYSIGLFSPMGYQEVTVMLSAQRRFLHALPARQRVVHAYLQHPSTHTRVQHPPSGGRPDPGSAGPGHRKPPGLPVSPVPPGLDRPASPLAACQDVPSSETLDVSVFDSFNSCGC